MENKEVVQQLQNMQAILEGLTGKVDEKQLQQMKNRVAEIDTKIQQRKMVESSIEKEIVDLRKKVNDIRAELEKIEPVLNSKQKELRLLKEKIAGETDQLNKIQNQQSFIEEKNISREVEIESKNKESVSFLKSVKEREIKLLERMKLLDMKEGLVNKQAQVNTIDIEKNKTLEKELLVKRAELEAYEAKLQNTEKKIKDLAVIIELMEKEVLKKQDAVNNRLIELSKLITENEVKSKVLDVKSKEADEARDQCQTRKKILDDNIKSLQIQKDKITVDYLKLVKSLDEKNTEEALNFLKEQLKGKI